jgi:phosphinothricin acetyltransferase
VSEIKTRRLTEASEQAAADLNNLLHQLTSRNVAPMDLERLKHLLSTETVVMVAEDDAKIVGVGMLGVIQQLVGAKCWVEDLVVDADYRGQGIAGRLMDALLEAVPANADTVNLGSKAERAEARAWYERLGFAPYSTIFRLKR